ncbi:MAG: hypothetical protein AAGC46_02515 [Solirubrobacteraceae bacterium]|nr:hypothetical protein [Patulibacter sp.]
MSDAAAKAQRSLDRMAATPEGLKKILRPLKNLVFGMPRDEASTWVLEKPEAADERYLDVLRFGACDFRETEHAHTMAAPVGWPRYMADAMDRKGVKLAFQNLFVWHFEEFPAESVIRKRRRKRRGAPDVIVIQTGGFSTMRHVFGYNLWSFLARENFGRRLGRLMHPIWRVMDVGLRLVGRPAPYYGPDKQLAEFIATVRSIWPGVPIEFWNPNEPLLKGSWRRDIAERLTAEATPILEDAHVPILEAPPIPNTMSLRGANGMNFNARGSQLVGDWYADHLLATYADLAKTPAERAAAAAETETPR